MAAKNRKSPATQTTARHVWLAGLGVVAMTRRELVDGSARMVEGLQALQRRAAQLANGATSNVRHGLDNVRGQVEPTVVRFSGEVEARLAPVLDKLGLKPKAAKPARRKPAATKAVRRPAARKPAQRTARSA
ncbi:phasin family protein [Lysobacter koreensis]|uniref:Phasin family protein n=1 Tax=Lysobacter koreensis TaxID=266122 RepID=A0ABW2YIR2_9GAMM